MHRWFNGGIRGSRISRPATTAATISAGNIVPRGRKNGGILGERQVTNNLDNNVNKTSGIWDLDGLVLIDHDVTTTQTIDNSYWEYPPPYEAFQQTSSTYLGGGYQWNVAYVRANCPGKSVQWPQGDYGGHSAAGYTGGLSRTWTTIGNSNNCESWVFDVYGIDGYYYTEYPDPIYHEVIEYQDVTNTYKVWDFF